MPCINTRPNLDPESNTKPSDLQHPSSLVKKNAGNHLKSKTIKLRYGKKVGDKKSLERVTNVISDPEN